MFTGIVQECAEVTEVIRQNRLTKYRVQSHLDENRCQLGASISVDGVCQTVVEYQKGRILFEAVEETLSKTTLDTLKPGRRVHLEASLTLQSGLDGHLVTGHVDEKGSVEKVQSLAEGRYDLRIRVPQGKGKYLLEGGCICLDGVSLTVFNVEKDSFSVTLIPETLKRTHLGSKQQGDPINLEYDVFGKWVEKLMGKNASFKLEDTLKEWGYGQGGLASNSSH